MCDERWSWQCRLRMRSSDAHSAGFIHGGLSPESIVITAKGHAKIPALELASRAGFDPERRQYPAPRLRFT